MSLLPGSRPAQTIPPTLPRPAIAIRSTQNARVAPFIWYLVVPSSQSSAYNLIQVRRPCVGFIVSLPFLPFLPFLFSLAHLVRRLATGPRTSVLAHLRAQQSNLSRWLRLDVAKYVRTFHRDRKIETRGPYVRR